MNVVTILVYSSLMVCVTQLTNKTLMNFCTISMFSLIVYIKSQKPDTIDLINDASCCLAYLLSSFT